MSTRLPFNGINACLAHFRAHWYDWMREGRTQWGSRKPLHSAMHAKVQHCTGFEVMLQPIVEGSILWVGRQIPLEQETHGVALHPQGRLHPYPNIPQLHTADQEIPYIFQFLLEARCSIIEI